MMTWTEDRAPVRTDPSAVPRAETEGWAVAQHSAAQPSLRDRHQCDKPLRQDAATALGTIPRLSPLRQALRIPVHAEPGHLEVKPRNLGQQDTNPGLRSEDGSQRGRNVRGRQRPRRYLMEQGLNKVEVAAIDQRDFCRTAHECPCTG